MSMRIAGIDFDLQDYDARGDTLYLRVGAPAEPARAVETPEGHVLEFDGDGRVISLELLGVRAALDGDGGLTLTWPPTQLLAKDLQLVLATG